MHRYNVHRYYSILELEFPATRDEIKKAFHRLAHIYHPDKQTGNEEKFKEINKAYHVLIQNGYWDALAKESQKGKPVTRASSSKLKVFFNDEGTEFWMEDEGGVVTYYWTANMSSINMNNWRDLDDSEQFKDYTKYIKAQ